jgi:8-oxo-dGTP pyrophosphatase MutT (NUDIX family)
MQQFGALFECRVVGGKVRADNDEVLEVGWFDLNDLPPMGRIPKQAVDDALSFRGDVIFAHGGNSSSTPPVQMPYVQWLRQHIGNQKIIMTGAAGMLRDARGRVLLQKRRDNGLWGFSGGAQELGESIADTVRREVREEVGLETEPRRLIGIYTSPEFDRVYEGGDAVQMFIAFFECEAVGGELTRQESEVLEIGWFDLDDLPPLMHCCAVKAQDARNFRGETFFR